MRGTARAARAEAMSAGELGLPEPDETGDTFHENARIKAQAAASRRSCRPSPTTSGSASMRSTGEPGIYSARWAGPGQGLRAGHAGVEDAAASAAKPTSRRPRPGSFRRSASPGRTAMSRSSRAGSTARCLAAARRRRISATIPMFLPDGHSRTFGEMTAEEKHGLPPRGLGLSHRARAFVMLSRSRPK